ncbi:Acyl-CoA dehydrogenase [Rubellimicrobium mesophilum DSM 19309]|uniref:Acyl-CoA dehydrogenase n=1 Tax=Rubellimicrobium mesophilum DSM 19309 TaxID=442562 RepID=A0A017HVC9_9RHOB|nr:Acyl-CoA dehydrogenase [Rubellimicrobium mesophilum DSM 19309]
MHHTRLDTAMAPAGLMRAALREAVRWCEGRVAFQRRLIDQPLMRMVLADMALDWEGALALGLRVAAAFDDPGQKAFARVGVALAKFLSNKRCVQVTAEAMECLGGMGYVEETPMPMLYREAPLNGIWEGSGNVICLDILRSLTREPEARAALEAELDAAKGFDAGYDVVLERHRTLWPGLPADAEARLFAERTATLLTASVLLRTVPGPVAESYVRGRLDPERGGRWGRRAGWTWERSWRRRGDGSRSGEAGGMEGNGRSAAPFGFGYVGRRTAMADDREERIRERAYRLWEQEGRPHGRHEDHWHQASQEVGDELFEQQGATDSDERRGALDGGLLPQDALVAPGGPAGSGLAGLGMMEEPEEERAHRQQG